MTGPKVEPFREISTLTRPTANGTVPPDCDSSGCAVYSLDAPEFQKFWDSDAERLVKIVRDIGKVE